jgi:GNAT superfamily N-acetyltransferase
VGDTLRIEREAGSRDRKAFVAFPYGLNRGQRGWIPPLRAAEKATMDRAKNPFFAHAEVQHFLARRGSRVVGRIAAVENRLHNETYGDRLGFFGFFDFEEDADACRGLVDAARAWLAARDLDRCRGPVSYSTNDVVGTLIDGFEEPPTVMMPWNRPYYDTLCQQAGLEKAKDLLAFRITREGEVPPRFRRAVERRADRGRFVLRPVDLDHLDGEIGRLLDVYNRCWADNWGFVPATEAEFRHAAKDMAPILERDMSCVAEVEGKPVGMSLILRDVNALLAGTDGRLWRALPKLLFGLKKLRRMRIIALGVVPEVRGRGISESMFLRSVDAGLEHGYTYGEASWILEDNRLMQAPILAVGGAVEKRYRVYEAPTAS